MDRADRLRQDAADALAAGSELDTPEEVATRIKRPPKTLAQWRSRGVGPRYFKLENGHVRYLRSDVDSWIAGGARHPQEMA